MISDRWRTAPVYRADACASTSTSRWAQLLLCTACASTNTSRWAQQCTVAGRVCDRLAHSGVTMARGTRTACCVRVLRKTFGTFWRELLLRCISTLFGRVRVSSSTQLRIDRQVAGRNQIDRHAYAPSFGTRDELNASATFFWRTI